MIVCHCAGVTDHAIAALLREGVATTVKEIVAHTGAGRCCGPCRDEIRSIVCSVNSELAAD